jgi:hypothetical protein
VIAVALLPSLRPEEVMSEHTGTDRAIARTRSEVQNSCVDTLRVV